MRIESYIRPPFSKNNEIRLAASALKPADARQPFFSYNSIFFSNSENTTCTRSKTSAGFPEGFDPS